MNDIGKTGLAFPSNPELQKLLEPNEDRWRLCFPPMELEDLIRLSWARRAWVIVRDFSAAPCRLRYQFTNGELIGYLADSCGTISTDTKSAKVYGADEATEKVNQWWNYLVEFWKQNEPWGTNNGKTLYYRDAPIWKGCTINDIEVVAEPIERTVLIVEDEERWQEQFKSFLPDTATVLQATSLAQAEKLYSENPMIDFIIMTGCVDHADLLDTIPLIKKIRETYKGEMVAISGSYDYVDDMIAAGCDCGKHKGYSNEIIRLKAIS